MARKKLRPIDSFTAPEFHKAVTLIQAPDRGASHAARVLSAIRKMTLRELRACYNLTHGGGASYFTKTQLLDKFRELVQLQERRRKHIEARPHGPDREEIELALECVSDDDDRSARPGLAGCYLVTGLPGRLTNFTTARQEKREEEMATKKKTTAAKKTTAEKISVPTGRDIRKGGVIASIHEALSNTKKGRTFDNLVEFVVKAHPDREPEKLAATCRAQVSRIGKERGYIVEHDMTTGTYRIAKATSGEPGELVRVNAPEKPAKKKATKKPAEKKTTKKKASKKKTTKKKSTKKKASKKKASKKTTKKKSTKRTASK